MIIQGQPENINWNVFSTINAILPGKENVWIVDPDSAWPEFYKFCEAQAASLHNSFSGNMTKGCVGQVNIVVDRELKDMKD